MLHLFLFAAISSLPTYCCTVNVGIRVISCILCDFYDAGLILISLYQIIKYIHVDWFNLWNFLYLFRGKLIGNRNGLFFASTWFHPGFFVGSVLLILLILCIVLCFCVVYLSSCVVYSREREREGERMNTSNIFNNNCSQPSEEKNLLGSRCNIYRFNVSIKFIYNTNNWLAMQY